MNFIKAWLVGRKYRKRLDAAIAATPRITVGPLNETDALAAQLCENFMYDLYTRLDNRT